MFHSCLKRTVMTTAVCLLVNYISVGANLYCTSTGWIEANPDGGEENLNSVGNGGGLCTLAAARASLLYAYTDSSPNLT